MNAKLNAYFPIRLDEGMRDALEAVSQETGFKKAALIRHGINGLLVDYNKTGTLKG